MDIEREVWLRISRAKISLFEHHPFYGHIATKMPIVLVDESVTKWSCTDGQRIFINPKGFLALPDKEQTTDLAHEQLHALDGHMWRMGSRDRQLANVAQDSYVYWILRDEGFPPLIENEHVLDQIAIQHGYSLTQLRGKTWEQIYDLLAPNHPPASDGNDSDADGDGGKSGGKGHGDDLKVGPCYKPTSGTEARGIREWVQETIREAGIAAKMAGAAPGHWQQIVDATMPKVPFETRLYEFLKRGLGGDQSYESFSRRWLHRGEYLPTEVVETMGETIGAVDTSGSRSDADIQYALGVLRSWRETHPCRFHLVQCDYDVPGDVGWTTYEEQEAMPSRFTIAGRGGTSFAPVFEQAKERNIEPAVLICITDGYGYEFASKPTYPVLWVLTGDQDRDFKPPYGEVIHVEYQGR